MDRKHSSPYSDPRRNINGESLLLIINSGTSLQSKVLRIRISWFTCSRFTACEKPMSTKTKKDLVFYTDVNDDEVPSVQEPNGKELSTSPDGLTIVKGKFTDLPNEVAEIVAGSLTVTSDGNIENIKIVPINSDNTRGIPTVWIACCFSLFYL